MSSLKNFSSETYDVIVIGAGAAGMMCAAQAGLRGRKVLLLDHSAKIGEKIRISGGGRCNFTNLNCAPDKYLSQNPHFAKSALSRYTQHNFIELVDSYDIAWHEKTLGQLFCDGKAQQIIDMMLEECRKADVSVKTGVTVEEVTKTDDGFALVTTKGPLQAEALVIATGSPAIPKIGATSFAYELANQFDVAVVEPRPALVPLTFTDEFRDLAKDLTGVSVDPGVVSNDRTSFREAFLFTHRGLSGPAILQISSYWREGEEITLNLAPDLDMYDTLRKAKAEQPKKRLHNVLPQFLPQRLCQKIISSDERNIADLPDAYLQEVANKVNNWRVKPNGSEGYRTAEVALGGVSTDRLSSKTFEARDVSGLYFIGEAVDVTGWLGGYNFQWAWSSGWCAGQAV